MLRGLHSCVKLRGLRTQGASEQRQVAIALNAVKALLGVERAGRGPAADHFTRAPAGDVAADAARAAHEVLDRVGGDQESSQRWRQAKFQHGQSFLQPLAQAGRRAGLAVALQPLDEGLEPAAGQFGRLAGPCLGERARDVSLAVLERCRHSCIDGIPLVEELTTVFTFLGRCQYMFGAKWASDGRVGSERCPPWALCVCDPLTWFSLALRVGGTCPVVPGSTSSAWDC